MKLNWLELLTRRLQPLRGQGGFGGLCMCLGVGGLVCYLIEWKILSRLPWCPALYRKEWFNGSCQTSSMSVLMVRALRSAVLYIKALAMTGRDGQMFASCFNCTVKRNTDISPPPLALKDRLWSKRRQFQATPACCTLALCYFRPL